MRAFFPWCQGVKLLCSGIFWSVWTACWWATPSTAQVAGEPPAVREPVRPRLLASIPVGRIRYWELREQTRGRLSFADGSTKEWQREVTYLLRLYAFSSREHDMTDVACRVEGLQYRFQQDTVVVEFDSQAPEKLRRRHPDLEYISAVLAAELEILFSSYGDIAHIRGEQLEWLRSYLRDELGEKSPELPAKLAAVSDGRWALLFDLHKGIVPGIRVREDSTWQRVVTLWLEGIEWRDTARVLISQTTDTTRILVGVLPALVPLSSTAWLPNAGPSPVTISEGRGHAQITVELAPRGLILRSQLHAHTEYTATPTGGSPPFRQTVQTMLTWRFVREE